MTLSGREGADEPWVVYPGNLQARSPKPSERGPKGAVVVQVRAGRVKGVEPVSCDVVRFELVEVDVAEVTDLADLRARLAASCKQRLDSAKGRSLVIRGRLVGRGEVASDLGRPGSIEGLLLSLRDDFVEDDPFAWWDCIDDRSRSLVDLDLVGSGSDFAADLVAMANELKRCLSTEHEAVAELAAELSDGLPGPLRTHRALEKLLDTPSAIELVDRALLLALGELDSDGR
jgi:hypothetical protein